MGLFDSFRKKRPAPAEAEPDSAPAAGSKEELYRQIFEMYARKSPSERFVSGAVFDLSRQNRDVFLQVLGTRDATSLLSLFIGAYHVFLANPGAVGMPADTAGKAADDTDPRMWNADCFTLPSGDQAALLFMPVRHDSLAARLVGIIFSDRGDGYYYCMLNGRDDLPSDVFRNKAWAGIEKVGEVSGRGFELMDSFLTCIRDDFCSGA